MVSLNKINGLNLKELDIIFSELNMLDQIELGWEHPKLREAFLFHNRGKFNGIILDDFGSEKWNSLLALCGCMVEWLVLHKDLELAMHYAAKHCQSLQEIEFDIQRVEILDEVGHRLSELTRLNSITLTWFADNDDIEHIEIVRFFQSMQGLPNLRKFELYFTDKTPVSHLRELTQLEELYLHGWNDSTMDLGYICGTLKNLRVLDFEGTIGDVDSYQALPQCCPLLEKLTLSARNIEQTPFFPKLKELKIKIRSAPIDQALGECGPRYAKQLDKLTIHTFEPIEEGELLEQLRGVEHFKILYKSRWRSPAPEKRSLNALM